MIHYTDDHLTVHIGDCREVLKTLPVESVHCVVTSPPYWGLRDYGVEGALGLEPTPEAFIASMVEVFREVRRVLRRDGTLWLNMGDSYAAQRGGTTMPAETLAGGQGGWMPDGSRVNRDRHDGYSPTRNASAIGLKHKDLVGMPWRLAFALQADGWYLRSDIIWSKPNPMPESVTDRPTKSHEYVFLLTKQARYFYDAEAVREASQDFTERGDYPEYQPVGPQILWRGWMRGGGSGAGDCGASGRGWKSDAEPVKPQAFRDYRNVGGRRNLRSVWQIATEPYPGAHFATFPQKLVEPCIKAGTSERGVCPECGAPWVREVERTSTQRQEHWSGSGRGNGVVAGGGHEGRTGQWHPSISTTGWQPSCADYHASPCIVCGRSSGHDHPESEFTAALLAQATIPATVLDPFAGSGTTGLVANRLGRRAILIDLSADYIDQAMLRNQQHPLGLIG